MSRSFSYLFARVAERQETWQTVSRFPANWDSVYTSWKAGDITAKTAMEQTGTKRTSFYKLVNMTENN